MKFIQKIQIAIFSILMLGGFLIAAPLTVNAQLFSGSADEACNGASLSDNGDCNAQQAEQQVNSRASMGITLFSIVIAIIAVIMIVIGGLKYITSMGDPSSVNSAKNTILYAIVGLVIAAMAQVIVRFVIRRV